MTHFSDFLNEHEEYANEYSNLKRYLSEKYPDDRFAYTDEKEGFVRMIY